VHQDLSFGGNSKPVRASFGFCLAPGFPLLLGMDLLPESLKAPDAMVLLLVKQGGVEYVHPIVRSDHTEMPSSASSAVGFGELSFTPSEVKTGKKRATAG
jgi:hypothetical protein